MEIIWSIEIDTILKSGRSLDIMGVRNWALTREAALQAVDQFCAINVAILGGDVYTLGDHRIESTYDSWFCNRNKGEAATDFVLRSIKLARKYIETYQPLIDNVLFAIVPNVEKA